MININNIVNLIIAVILNFPILISIIGDFLKYMNKKYPNFLFGFFKILYKNIILKIETLPKFQIQSLYFNSIIQFIHALIFFGNVNFFSDYFKVLIKKKIIPTKYKLFLLFQNIFITLLIFFINPLFQNYIV